MTFNDAISVVSAVAAVGAVIYAARQARVQHRREDFELARSLHADLTSGLVAEARNILSAVPEKRRGFDRQLDIVQIANAYFTLLWCFERVYSGRQSIARRDRTPDAVVFLDSLVTWHVARWWGAFADVRREIGDQTKGAINDQYARVGYERLFLVLFSDDAESKFKRLDLTPPEPDEVQGLREKYADLTGPGV
ncbi:hypothetical protein ABH926_003643 [Catenulispora sp. GP43]|uniref:hypothetical protein n=1 Tax=Catenulispora sp. GP43 TaxID=3156263 RepID=UPI003515BFDE